MGTNIVKEELEIAYCLATNQAYPHKIKNTIRTIHISTCEADINIVWPLMHHLRQGTHTRAFVDWRARRAQLDL